MIERCKFIFSSSIKSLIGSWLTSLVLGIANCIGYIFPLIVVIMLIVMQGEVRSKYPGHAEEVLCIESQGKILLPESHDHLFVSIPEIERFSYEYTINEQIIYSNSGYSDFRRVLVVDQNYMDFYNLDNNHESTDTQCIVGTTVAKQLFQNENPIDQVIQFGDSVYTVTNVTSHPSYSQNIVIVSDLQDLPSWESTAKSRLLIKITSTNDVQKARERLEDLFAGNHFKIKYTDEEITREILESRGTFIAIAVIGLLVTLFVILGVGNITYLLSNMESRSIAIKYSLGVGRRVLVLETIIQLSMISSISLVGSCLLVFPVVVYIEGIWDIQGMVINSLTQYWSGLLLSVLALFLVLIFIEVYISIRSLLNNEYKLQIR